MSIQLYRVAAALLLASLLLAACGGPVTTEPVVETQYVFPTPGPVVTQPPVPLETQPVGFHSADPTTFTQVQANDPDTLDPVVSTAKEGMAIIQNVYETLVFFKRDSVTDFVPHLAEEVPTLQNGGISPDGRIYTFKIRQGVKFHNGDPLTPSDVAFSLQRLILSGGSSSPAWLLFEPLLGSSPNNDITDLIDPYGTLLDNRGKLVDVLPYGLKAMCNRVQNLIKADDQAGTVTIRLVQPWGPFLMILSGPYSSIMDKQWVAKNGGWDGSCDTWQKFYDPIADEQNKLALGHSENGTGPYMLDHWTPGQELVLKAFSGYWRTQPAWDGGPVGAPKLATIKIQLIKGFSGRFNAFRSGTADAIGFYNSAKPTSLDELVGETCDLQGNCAPTNLPASPIRVYNNVPANNRMDALFNYNINVVDPNPLIGSGVLDGNGIPPNFFSDASVRQAFSYCFNWDTYIQQALNGQGRQVTQVMLPGELGSDPNGPHYSYDSKACADAFKASAWHSVTGKSLWDTGFKLSIVINPRMPASQVFADILSQSISAVNDKFVIQVVNLPWESYMDAYRNKRLPLFFANIRQFIADPHNWVEPLTTGNYGSGLQRMPKGMFYQFNTLVTRGVQTTDPALRAEVYKQFNQLFFNLAPSITLAQELDKRFEQRWVSGYYYNPMYADLYYYVLSKQ